METIAQEALRLLEPIPERQWMLYDFTNRIDKCCAMGHYLRLKSKRPDDYSYSNCSTERSTKLRTASKKFLKSKGSWDGSCIAAVNNGDGDIPGYGIYRTPKARVIHLLKDMVAAGF